MVIALRSKLGHFALRQRRLVATRLNQALRVRDVDSAKVDGKGILQSFVRLRVFAALLHLADGFDNSPGQVEEERKGSLEPTPQFFRKGQLADLSWMAEKSMAKPSSL